MRKAAFIAIVMFGVFVFLLSGTRRTSAIRLEPNGDASPATLAQAVAPSATPLPPVTPIPTDAPIMTPAPLATPAPAVTPSPAPTATPTLAPTATPTPTPARSRHPASAPPSALPSPIPVPPTAVPTAVPTIAPTPTPAPTAIPTPAPSPVSLDHAYSLIGLWSCETMGNAEGTHQYALGDDGSIGLRNVLQVEKNSVEIRETYRFDLDRKVWKMSTQGGVYTGTAPPWRSERWIFEGVEIANGRPRPVRMVYTDLGAQAFRRDFQASLDGAWRTFSAETCKRF